SSKVDLNQASETLLTALFQLAGVSQGRAQSLAAAVADFRDPDDQRRVNGAENKQYQSAGLSWGPKNSPFQSIDELQQVLGITPEIYRNVVDNITVYALTPVFIDESPRGLAKFLLETKTKAKPSLDAVFSIRAESLRTSGAAFVREMIVQPNHDFGT